MAEIDDRDRASGTPDDGPPRPESLWQRLGRRRREFQDWLWSDHERWTAERGYQGWRSPSGWTAYGRDTRFDLRQECWECAGGGRHRITGGECGLCAGTGVVTLPDPDDTEDGVDDDLDEGRVLVMPWMRMTVKLLAGGEVRRPRPNPVVGLYRWRWEAALLAVVIGLVRLGYTESWAVPAAVVLVVAAALVAAPTLRRVLGRRCRAVVVQHRLRSAFHELCLTTWAGRSPAILWTAPRCDGVRVHLLCPAGIAPAHFTADVCDTLAAACDALEVRAVPHPRHSALLVLVVVTHVAVSGRPAPRLP